MGKMLDFSPLSVFLVFKIMRRFLSTLHRIDNAVIRSFQRHSGFVDLNVLGVSRSTANTCLLETGSLGTSVLCGSGPVPLHTQNQSFLQESVVLSRGEPRLYVVISTMPNSESRGPHLLTTSVLF